MNSGNEEKVTGIISPLADFLNITDYKIHYFDKDVNLQQRKAERNTIGMCSFFRLLSYMFISLCFRIAGSFSSLVSHNETVKSLLRTSISFRNRVRSFLALS